MDRGPVLCIVHQRTSFPARLGRLFMERGFHLDVRCPGVGQALPRTPDGYAATVMFGGPMSANDCHLPAIREELAWTERAAVCAPPFVGVCLGAQILARALGAKVWADPGGQVEIGYAGLRPTQAGRDLFDAPMHVYQWHKEGFDLPEGAALLAAGPDAFPNQCFRYGAHCYAVQFHPEVTLDMVERWTVGGQHMLDRPGAMPREDQIRLHAEFDPPLDAWTNRFVDHVIALAEARGACAPARAAAAA